MPTRKRGENAEDKGHAKAYEQAQEPAQETAHENRPEKAEKSGDAKGRRSPPAPKELQNPLEFVRLGLEAAKGGAPAMFLWAGGSIFALGGVMLPALLGTSPHYALATFAVTVLAVVVLTWLAAKNPANFEVQREWRVIQQPLRGDRLEQLTKEMKAVHAVAANAINKPKGAGFAGKVRANIFLVDYRRAPEGIGLELRMPAQLRVMMLEPKEWEITFQPGAGATGEAFRSAQPVLTKDRLYGVPPGQRDVYDHLLVADLNGIISLPLFATEQANVIAVLNIDLCGGDVTYEDLTMVYETVKSSAHFNSLQTLLNKLDKAWLTIGLRRG